MDMDLPRLGYGHIVNDGVKIQYYRTGGEKPPVVLLHGLTDNGMCWGLTALSLQPYYDMVMIDARGHGLSDAPETGYGAAEHASDVAALIRELKLKKPVVMGHSMGAANALHTAAFYPDLVGGLVLEDPPFIDPPAQEPEGERASRAEEWRKGILAMKSQSMEALIKTGKTMHPNWHEDEFFQWATGKQQVRPQVVQFITTPDKPWREVAALVKCPVLLLTGDPQKGGLVTPEIAEKTVKLWRKGRLVNIPGVGHNIRREGFEPYFKAVKSFLSEVVG
jgi:pimeloyl-ACP methyl ester carboxylesterase